MQRKITTTFTLELEQLERLADEAKRSGINRSIIVREAIERELARRNEQPAKVDGGQVVDAVVAVGTARPT